MSRSSQGSLRDEPRFVATVQEGRQDRKSNNSPLRVKSMSSHSRESLPTSVHRNAKENKWTPTDTNAGHIAVYSPEVSGRRRDERNERQTKTEVRDYDIPLHE